MIEETSALSLFLFCPHLFFLPSSCPTTTLTPHRFTVAVTSRKVYQISMQTHTCYLRAQTCLQCSACGSTLSPLSARHFWPSSKSKSDILLNAPKSHMTRSVSE